MIHKLTDNEAVKFIEEVGINGKEYKVPDGANIFGEVEVIQRSFSSGKPIFTKTKGHNDLLVTGSVYMSEKLNGMRSSFRTVPVDVQLGVHRAEDVVLTSENIANERICGIMVGEGGCASNYDEVYKVNRASTHVPGMIPFRVVPQNNDLTGTEREKYFLRTVQGGYVYYYGKRFNTEQEINVMYEDGTAVPIDIDATTTNKFIKIFTKYSITINSNEIREYYKITQGSTRLSRVNSCGLIAGFPGLNNRGEEEFFNVRTLTTFNMENHALKDSESKIDIIYRVHIQ